MLKNYRKQYGNCQNKRGGSNSHESARRLIVSHIPSNRALRISRSAGESSVCFLTYIIPILSVGGDPSEEPQTIAAAQLSAR